jgi:FKBP12-rapamycin complex-associated protein
MTSTDAPSELVQTLLNLAEFMEHEEKPLPIEHRTLGDYAMKNGALAKALHYKELEFFSETSPSIIEALIGINTKLQQHDAAWGTLLIARDQYNIHKQEEWYEKLGRWQDALIAYDDKIEQDPDAIDAAMGRMRCLHALGAWDELAGTIEKNFSVVSPDEQREMAPMGAAAAWCTNEWNAMGQYIEFMNNDSADRAFYKAIHEVHDNNFSKANANISKARDLLDLEMTAVVGESYGRSYKYDMRYMRCFSRFLTSNALSV